MSQRGPGPGPHQDDVDDEDAARERPRDAHRHTPSPPPILPYDPYRSSSGSGSRRRGDAPAGDAFDDPAAPARHIGDDPFLPVDDPLSAEAWQLDLEEADDFEGDIAAPPAEPRRDARSSRRRRQSPTSRGARQAEPDTGIRRRVRRATPPASSMRDRMARGGIAISVPRAVTSSSLFADQTVLILMAINVVSLVLMVLLLAVRLGALPNPIVLRLDAAGNPDRWGPPSALWRLPLMAFFLTVMFMVVAWFLHPIDRFAARFAVGAAAVAQLVAWVAVMQFLFVT